MSDDQHQIILDHYGKDGVLAKLGEEASELSAAVHRLTVAEKDDDPAAHGKAYLEVLGEWADILEVSARMRLFADMEYVNQTRIEKRNRTLKKVWMCQNTINTKTKNGRK